MKNVFWLKIVFFLFALFFSSPLHAIEAGEALADPALEARAVGVGEIIRCVVCEGQSVNDSAAPLAKNMRGLIREKIKAGATDQEIRSYLSSRYGEGILFTPPVKAETYALWAAPWALLLAALGFYGLFLKNSKRRV